MNWIRFQVKCFLAVWLLLTRIPLPFRISYDPRALAKGHFYFPIVGGILGTLVAATFYISNLVFSPPISVWIAITSGVLLTGAFHEDGLADTLDGLGGGLTRDKKLSIMKDSRIGSYGSAGLILLFLGKIEILSSLPSFTIIRGLVIGFVVSRLSSVCLLGYLPYVGMSQFAKPLADTVSWTKSSSILFLTFCILAIWDFSTMLILLPVFLVLHLFLYRFLKSQIGGVTGDSLGFANQITEIFVYLTIASESQWNRLFIW